MEMRMSKVEYLLSEVPPSEEAIVISFNDEGEMTLHSTIKRGPDILWALEMAKGHVLEMGQPSDD